MEEQLTENKDFFEKTSFFLYLISRLEIEIS